MPDFRFVHTSLLVASLCFLVPAPEAFAQAPDSLSFQGFLTRPSGEPLDSTDVSMTFKLYKGATAVWSGTQLVDVNNGVFNVLLGKSLAMDTVAFDQPIELGIKLDGEASEMSPRTPLAAAAWARALPGLYTYHRKYSTSDSYNVVGGAPGNIIGPNKTGVTISGGGGVAYGTIGPNSVTESFGTVGGGYGNEASGLGATIAGGYENTAAGEAAFVGSGRGNSAEGDRAVIGGGGNNVASNDRSTVGGGRDNEATGDRSTVAGGYNGHATGTYSTVGGGSSNQAAGKSATVPGGQQNLATGNYSLAMGHKANAATLGSFVWQDSSGSGYLAATMKNQFLARASGGFKLLTSEASDITDAGVELVSGSGTWADLSSVSTKTAFQPIDVRDYLDRVAGLDIKQWSYKTEDPGITHVGPMAEDFHAAFGHGHNATSITTIDASGVAMAAIQGLYELVKEQQAEIERLRALIIDD